MKEVDQLLLQNRAWAAEMLLDDGQWFSRTLPQQRPAFLWIGCSDSRVAPEQFTNAVPGGLFLHRNIANLVQHDDQNLMAVLAYAVDVLGVDHIVVCGHHGCGGIAATIDGGATGPVGAWLEHARDVYDAHRETVDACATRDEKVNRLVEFNVRDQLVHLAETGTVRAAFAAGRDLELHGWVYDLRDGLIKQLVTIDRDTPLDAVPTPGRVLLPEPAAEVTV